MRRPRPQPLLPPEITYRKRQVQPCLPSTIPARGWVLNPAAGEKTQIHLGVWKHERCITLDALKDVAPRAIFCCGKDALWCVRDLLSDLARQPPDPFRIAEVEGRVFREVESPWGSVAVVGCRHLTGVWRGDEKKVALGDALRDALGDI